MGSIGRNGRIAFLLPPTEDIQDREDKRWCPARIVGRVIFEQPDLLQSLGHDPEYFVIDGSQSREDWEGMHSSLVARAKLLLGV